MRETLRQKLGDHSSLEALTERLELAYRPGSV